MHPVREGLGHHYCLWGEEKLMALLTDEEKREILVNPEEHGFTDSYMRAAVYAGERGPADIFVKLTSFASHGKRLCVESVFSEFNCFYFHISSLF